MSKSVKYMTVLLVVIISFFGFSSAWSYLSCSQSAKSTLDYYTKLNKMSFGYGDSASYNKQGLQACSTVVAMNMSIEDAGSMGKNIFAGTLFLDGVIAILYYLFSKSKKKAAEEKSATSSHEKLVNKVTSEQVLR